MTAKGWKRALNCLMVTFFVVILVLMPMMDENAAYMLYGGSMLYQHTLCPILAAAFFVLEPVGQLLRREILKALIPTLAYALAAIILNLCRVIEGPYPFLRYTHSFDTCPYCGAR